MKAITVKQPWASLIIEGIKDIENRTWKTNFRGRVLVHASAKQLNNKDLLSIEKANEINSNLLNDIEDGNLPTGAIIGSVEIVDCVINHPSIWAEKSETNCSAKCRAINCKYFIDWDFGQGWCASCKLIGQSYEVNEAPKDCPHKIKINTIYNWALANPIKFLEPIPCKGKLSFWESECEVLKCPSCSEYCLHDNRDVGIPNYGNPVHQCEHCGYTILESEFEYLK